MTISWNDPSRVNPNVLYVCGQTSNSYVVKFAPIFASRDPLKFSHYATKLDKHENYEVVDNELRNLCHKHSFNLENVRKQSNIREILG